MANPEAKAQLEDPRDVKFKQMFYDASIAALDSRFGADLKGVTLAAKSALVTDGDVANRIGSVAKSAAAGALADLGINADFVAKVNALEQKSDRGFQNIITALEEIRKGLAAARSEASLTPARGLGPGSSYASPFVPAVSPGLSRPLSGAKIASEEEFYSLYSEGAKEPKVAAAYAESAPLSLGEAGAGQPQTRATTKAAALREQARLRAQRGLEPSAEAEAERRRRGRSQGPAPSREPHTGESDRDRRERERRDYESQLREDERRLAGQRGSGLREDERRLAEQRESRRLEELERTFGERSPPLRFGHGEGGASASAVEGQTDEEQRYYQSLEASGAGEPLRPSGTDLTRAAADYPYGSSKEPRRR